MPQIRASAKAAIDVRHATSIMLASKIFIFHICQSMKLEYSSHVNFNLFNISLANEKEVHLTKFLSWKTKKKILLYNAIYGVFLNALRKFMHLNYV